MDNCFDVDTIKQQFADVLQYSQEFRGKELRGIDQIFDKWYQNKKKFIKHFNGHLICGIENVSFELDDKAKMDKINIFAGRIYDYYNNKRLARWLEDLSSAEFYNNHTTQEYCCEWFSWDGKQAEDTIIIPENFKVVKAFKFFEPNEDKLKQMQSEASQIIQENIVSGDLCLSVHPLDYLSISENVHNWRSCHALDGEFRSGNLSYMVDSSTVICYLRADKQAILPHFPENVLWNSKKWRVLLFFSTDETLLLAGRQYPFFADQSLENIRNKLLPQLNFGHWTKWKNTMMSGYEDKYSKENFIFPNMIPVGDTLKPFKSIIHEPNVPLFFNDLLRSSCYSPMWSYRQSKNDYWWFNSTGTSSENTHLDIGEDCICPICGKNNIIYTDMMICSDCANHYDYTSADYGECEVCGNITHVDDLTTLVFSGARVCPHCYETETVRCQECGEVDLPEIVKYHDHDERRLCPDCWADTRKDITIEDITITIKGD